MDIESLCVTCYPSNYAVIGTRDEHLEWVNETKQSFYVFQEHDLGEYEFQAFWMDIDSHDNVYYCLLYDKPVTYIGSLGAHNYLRYGFLLKNGTPEYIIYGGQNGNRFQKATNKERNFYLELLLKV